MDSHRGGREDAIADLNVLTPRPSAKYALVVSRDKNIADLWGRTTRAHSESIRKQRCPIASQRSCAQLARVHVTRNERGSVHIGHRRSDSIDAAAQIVEKTQVSVWGDFGEKRAIEILDGDLVHSALLQAFGGVGRLRLIDNHGREILLLGSSVYSRIE